MSLDRSRKDFEEALEEMKVVVEAMESCIDSSLLSTLSTVINEYEMHYSNDINELIIECDELQSMLDEAIGGD